MTAPDILRDASVEELEQAAAANHRELFCLNATSVGGKVHDATDGAWTNVGSRGGSMIAFPSWPDGEAGARIDAILDDYRHCPPTNVGCWSLDPPQPRDLGVRLLARGFHPGWRPHWMALDLHAMNTQHPRPAGLHVAADRETPVDAVKNLPYARADGAVFQSVVRDGREQVQRFVATLRGRVVAHSCVLLTTGPRGVAGIYNVGVVPGERNRGVGKAVTIAACLYARERNYRYAVLNATGRRMYEQIGFKTLRDGLTWWLNVPRWLARPPGPEEIALAEAVGRGDLAALDRLGCHFTAAEVTRPLSNEMSLMQLAVKCEQPASAEWLLAHGSPLYPLEAWDLGWRAKTAELLAAHPEWVDRQYGEFKTTLLHVAADRDDEALAKLALAARPNVQITDAIYNSTALDWAKHLRRESIARLIENYMTA